MGQRNLWWYKPIYNWKNKCLYYCTINGWPLTCLPYKMYIDFGMLAGELWPQNVWNRLFENTLWYDTIKKGCSSNNINFIVLCR